MYTSPTIGEYSYTDTIVSDGIAHSVLWATKPSFNPSGTKMLYYSERAGYRMDLYGLWIQLRKRNP
jgi:Tol biopolymer transport system component